VRAPLWLKLAAVSGFVVSVVAGYFTLVPITRVDSPFSFALKIIVVVIAANAIGFALYRLRKRPDPGVEKPDERTSTSD
jgi:hypothetical protein